MTALSAYILDDDPQVRAMVLHVLEGAGYEVHEFPSPDPMMARLAWAPPAVIVLDLALGQSDAVEVIHRLEVLNYRGKVLLISGRDETVLAEVQKIGGTHRLAMLASLKKPFRAKDLIARLMETPETVEATASEPVPAPRAMTVSLEQAIDEGWLELWYQPKVDLRSFALYGAEALLRARHPEHGIIFPAELLPPAGDPLHFRLARFVMARAIADWQNFADHGKSLRLAVNLPVCVLNAPEFVALMRQHLPAYPRFPGLIIEVAAQLKLLNVRISFDDFGIAYSSLSRLLEVSCVEMKLDRSYVSQCSSDPLKYALCQTVVDLAHRVGSTVCAEGIETPEDLRSVIAMGCDSAQGFLFAKPMPPETFVTQVIARDRAFAKHFSRTADGTLRAASAG
jgi:EAL domain-containing protein (putative c-di-GMP-specific phosphodiesterase class I)/FixJ family two-component response regulator